MKKKIISLSILMLLLISTITPSFATVEEAKEENVYGNLGENGEVEGIYVVNEFVLENQEEIVDYGKYEEVRNLSSSEPIKKEEEKITFQGNQGKNYYQGMLNTKELPWNITVNYYLNDEEIAPKELAGKSGRIKIKIVVQKNEKINTIFFNNYLLQTTLSLNSETCSNLEAKDATIANVGKKKQLTYNIFAGEEKEIIINYDTTDFELEDGISFNGVVMKFAIDNLDTSELTDAVQELQQGVATLNNGTTNLRNGSQKYKTAVEQLASKTKDLPSQSKEILEGVENILQGIQTMEKQTVQGTTNTEKEQMTKAISAQIEANLKKDEKYQTLVKTNPEMAQYIKQNLLQTSTQTAKTVAEQYEKQISNSMKELKNGLSALEAGTATLRKAYTKMDTGISTLTSNIQTISKSYGEINNGIQKVTTGTTTLNNETKDMDGKIEEKMEEMKAKFKNEDFKPVSYVSEQNTKVEAVQFIIKVKGIQKEEIKEEEKQEESHEKIFSKFIKLFQNE